MVVNLLFLRSVASRTFGLLEFIVSAETALKGKIMENMYYWQKLVHCIICLGYQSYFRYLVSKVCKNLQFFELRIVTCFAVFGILGTSYSSHCLCFYACSLLLGDTVVFLKMTLA
ncbi:hypothetical protein AMTRI_Chr02g211770 [Amborella trichopoda]